jgi:hypothetical protein
MSRPTEPLARRARAALANVALLVASVVVVLLVAEAGTRLFSPIGPALLVTDPVIGKRFVPGYAGSVFVDEAGREVFLRFNHEGFRGPDWPLVKPPGTRRLAVVGDSMIAAVAVDEEKTLVRRLGDLLGTGVEVLNFGVSSSSTGQELLLYRRLVAAYRPDTVVLVFFVGNDFADNSSRLTRAPRVYFDLNEDGALRLESVPAAPGAVTRWLNLHSRFYVWQKRALRRLRGQGRSLAGGLEPVQRVFEVSDDPDLAHAWALLEALLRQFKTDVEADGSRFLLVVIPSADQVHDDLWAQLETQAAANGLTLDRDLPERRLDSIARSAGIDLVDLTPVFRQATAGRPSDDPGSLYLLGRYHLSDEGQRLAAEVLASHLP